MGNKYHFNPETLLYEKRTRSRGKRILHAVLLSFSALAIGYLLMLAYSMVIETPRMRALSKESDELLGKVKILQEKVRGTARQIAEIERRDNQTYRTIFEADSVASVIRQGGTGGSKRYVALELLPGKDQFVDLAKSIDQLSWRTYIQSKSFDEVVDWAHQKERMLQCMPAVQPVSNRELTRGITSFFGMRRDPFTKKPKMHKGLDFVAPHGSSIHATGDGVVVRASYSRGGYGNQVVIDHGFGYKTRYAHLSKIEVQEGDRIKRGQIIGRMGSTGRSTATHLHYEVLVKNVQVNPLNYFSDMSDEEYEQMLANSVITILD